MHKMDTSVCDQLPSTPPKLIQNYSEYEESSNDRHYRCSPLVLKATTHFNACHQININAKQSCVENNPLNALCKNIDCDLRSSFTLDDTNEKMSTTQNTPTDELYSKLMNINNTTNPLTISSEFTNDQSNAANNAQSVYSSDDNTTGSLTSLGGVVCCRDSGSLFCCDEFENRIFQWLESNVPKMTKPEEKRENYFEERRNTLIRSVSISQKQAELLQQYEAPTMDLSLTSSTSSIPAFTKDNQVCSISKISSFPVAAETQSMKIIEGIEKFGSSLLKRRQSQVLQTSTINRLSQNKRLSIMTITQPFNKSEEKN